MSLHTNDDDATEPITTDSPVREGGHSLPDDAGWDGDPAELPAGLRPTETGFWITKGNGGTSRRLHDDPDCPAVNSTGHNATSLRPASPSEVDEVRSGDREYCTRCAGDRGGDTGTADTFSAHDVRKLAAEDRLDELGDLVDGGAADD